MLFYESDEDAVILYKNGNPEALKILIDRYASPLYNFTARMANKNNASDIVQETFIKIWKNISHFDPSKASFKTWIFAVAKNAITDFLRKKSNLLFSDMESGNGEENLDSFEENIPDEQALPDITLQKLQDKELLENVLNKLQSRYREILVLHYQEEMTFDEIGKILDKSINTVKSQHRRALLKLRKMLT